MANNICRLGMEVPPSKPLTMFGTHQRLNCVDITGTHHHNLGCCKELKLSYYGKGTQLFTIYPYLGNLTSVP